MDMNKGKHTTLQETQVVSFLVEEHANYFWGELWRILTNGLKTIKQEILIVLVPKDSQDNFLSLSFFLKFLEGHSDEEHGN